MIFDRIAPKSELNRTIKEFWVYENHNSTSEVQKIIPDGFSEIIVHYGDSYQINLTGTWELQSRHLFSSQISKFFHLKNTGTSGMIGMKLFPEAGYELFNVDMSGYTDRVISLDELMTDVSSFSRLISKECSTEERISVLEDWVENVRNSESDNIKKVRNTTDLIFESNGMIDIQALSEAVEISTRQLERLFKRTIGTTIKFFSRIIRFNYIFQLMKNKELSWIQVALKSGYFDQSHFIKNFKEFTGEEPTNYGFDEQTLANFFLKK